MDSQLTTLQSTSSAASVIQFSRWHCQSSRYWHHSAPQYHNASLWLCGKFFLHMMVQHFLNLKLDTLSRSQQERLQLAYIFPLLKVNFPGSWGRVKICSFRHQSPYQDPSGDGLPCGRGRLTPMDVTQGAEVDHIIRVFVVCFLKSPFRVPKGLPACCCFVQSCDYLYTH